MPFRSVLQLALVVLAAGAALAPVPPPVVEQWYSLWIFPRVQSVVTPVSNLVPFALFDLLVAGAMVFGLWRIARAAREARADYRTRRDDGSGSPMLARVARAAMPVVREGGRLAVGAAVVYLAFLALWGLNYRRVPMIQRLAVAVEAPDTAAVVALGEEAVARMNALHAEAHRRGWDTEAWRGGSLAGAFESTQRAISSAPAARPGRLKWTIFGLYFRWAGIDGMVDPFALEALVNPDLLPWERPFVAAHEWAHLAGYAHEAEASFVGWIACVRADPPSQYSGWLNLYWQVASELPRDEGRRLAEALEAGPRADIQAISERLRRGRFPLLRRASWRVYDHYLKANRVEEGVRSYGEVVNLILRARFEDGWVPVRAGAGSS